VTAKYELTGKPNAQGLRRIRALRSFDTVKEGDLGGWIAGEHNLSHYGAAWVYGDAQVYGYARVYGAAWVYGDAWVYGAARVYVDARVYGAARVSK